LELNQGNEIPHIFEGNQFSFAVLDLLVVRLLKIEENFKVVEFEGLSLKNAGLLIVL